MTEASLIAQRAYVAMMRMLRSAVRRLGDPTQPLSYRRSRRRHWLRSLLAIHDIAELIRLDVPWWTYDAIEQVEDFLGARESPRVFEYGSGASTVWLAKRAGSVVSIDHDRAWIEFSQPWLAQFANATLAHVPADARCDGDLLYVSGKSGHRGTSFRGYVDAIDSWPGPFDLIVIDGRARAACLRKAVDRLAADGLIVFDNSRRRRYREAIASSGLEAQVTRGLVPSLPYPDQTTLLRPARRAKT